MGRKLLLSNDAGTKYVNLLGGVFERRIGSMGSRGWTDGDTDPVIEVLDVTVRDATDIEIINAENDLSDLAEAAKVFPKDRLRAESVWLEENANSESARRAFVHGFQFVPYSIENHDPLLNTGAFFGKLAITRAPFWETKTKQTLTQANLSCWGGKMTITRAAYLDGTKPARIQRLSLLFDNDDLVRYWFGVRPTYQGISSFQAVWELESGTLGTDSSLAADLAASPAGSHPSNNMVQCSFGTSAYLLERVSMTVDQACSDANYKHFVGRYLVLLRAQMTAGSTTINVQMRSGVGDAMVIHERVTVDSQIFKLYELGEISIPHFAYRGAVVGNDVVKNYTIEVWAERTAGAAELCLDALCLIPSDHLVSAKEVVTNSLDTGWAMEFYTFEDDETLAVLNKAGLLDPGMESSFRDFYLPVEGGVAVLAADCMPASEHQLDAVLDVTLDYFPRWRHYSPYA